MNILAYVKNVPFEVANEALFYCSRAFNVLDWPKELRRDFFFDAPEYTPGPASRAITLAILAGIEEQERCPLDEVDKSRLRAYEREIGDAGDALLDQQPSGDTDCIDELLRELREGAVAHRA